MEFYSFVCFFQGEEQPCLISNETGHLLVPLPSKVDGEERCISVRKAKKVEADCCVPRIHAGALEAVAQPSD
ncbi:hypothetical protein TGPRC2_209410 [Toxoplasma gondii TgCatPRC2]|uniref:Uncharacterized protein n=4 Tax=Toxoplasma gondii TaxID=5811 RepID=A0A151HH05_TOXGO|nr:hypothetical protein TGRUB_209410 [Toxoplasma gondii RUB]KYK68584.1 hypothetical protein TGPRC2_209410 [Toxoplasma gondii TgCatPRC2]PIL98641.1 hypothetical protein TGCOUG_209410 [Toxoplasma gondii COUG]PUA88191.1 hypothetical protein TGBR9_209410 [Toxoplasma gondii TgCATBr9]